ncbi:MAG: hypothetical protein HY823_00365 [Acidobacteria bacterium]|nr:hypothetical protein [Acidobacteriota bacterium]
MNRCALLFPLACAAFPAEVRLPLPEAPVRVLIPDVATFDANLTGAYRRFATGQPKPGDPLLSAWRRTQVGSKLEDQWTRFSEFLPLTWGDIRKLQATSLGLALLEVGHLEALVILETPLAALPVPLPKGERKTHGGVSYTLVAHGAADPSRDPDRRMGLAWAHSGTRLFLATSERALKLGLDEALAGRGLKPPMEGFVSMELNLDALRKDRYFRREFPFEAGPEGGRIRAALRKEGGGLVEVREGLGGTSTGVGSFEAPAAAACGWEPEGSGFWVAFRRGLLEPVPAPAERPVAGLRPLPDPAQENRGDRYAVDLTRAVAGPGEASHEEGDLGVWKDLLRRTPVAHWGWWVGRDGVRRMVFPWPEAQDKAFLDACQATLSRRGGRSTVVTQGGIREVRVGAQFPVLALRRTGAYLWVSGTARDLQAVTLPQADPDLLRWAKVDLAAVRAETPRWARAEGPPRPEEVRPLSDRVVGLLGWMPATSSISVERRKTAGGWSETVHFGAPAK